MDGPKWALMVRRESGRVVVEEVTEDLVETARDLGWELLVKDSDVPVKSTPPFDPSQSNPRRKCDDEEGD